jgi:hypothetical protein
MNKVAVGLFGVHYIDQLNHWMNWKHRVDFRESIQNNKQFLYKDFDCVFFSSTYFSSEVSALITEFKFKALKLKHVDNSNQSLKNSFAKRNKIFLETIELILDDAHSYDYVMLTRYDLLFNHHLFDNIHEEKVNIICRAKWGEDENLLDDNFYFMPHGLLNEFYYSIKTMPITESSHTYNKYFKNFHFILGNEKSYYSHEIPTYTIKRGNQII